MFEELYYSPNTKSMQGTIKNFPFILVLLILFFTSSPFTSTSLLYPKSHYSNFFLKFHFMKVVIHEKQTNTSICIANQQNEKKKLNYLIDTHEYCQIDFRIMYLLQGFIIDSLKSRVIFTTIVCNTEARKVAKLITLFNIIMELYLRYNLINY